MRYVELPYPATTRPLPFYLAMEEYLAALPEADADLFFMWQVEPTVIFGRNQDAEAEVDMDYCRAHGIRFFRRKSGGGCVYADMDNVMLSYITRTRQAVADTFGHYTSAVAGALRGMGLDANPSGRNDIEIRGMKVSGNAFYHTPTASIVHGTMLIDTDMAHMARAITPSRSKLAGKGVASVPARITTLRRHLSITIPDFIRYMKETLCQEPPLQLDEADVIEIERITRSYYDPAWIYGAAHRRPTVVRHAHIPDAGHFRANITLDSSGHISHIDLSGDFFPLADTDALLRPLQGAQYTREAITEALAGVHAHTVIRGLHTTDFINLIIPQQ